MKVRRRVARAMCAMVLAVSVIPLMAVRRWRIGTDRGRERVNGPYKLTEGPDGAIYVAESGTGGTTCSVVVGPDGESVEVCVGSTGSVTRIGTTTSRSVTGLPSVSGGGEAIGPTAVDFDSSGQMYVLIGQGGNADTRVTLGDPRSGRCCGYRPPAPRWWPPTWWPTAETTPTASTRLKPFASPSTVLSPRGRCRGNARSESRRRATYRRGGPSRRGWWIRLHSFCSRQYRCRRFRPAWKSMRRRNHVGR